MPRNRKFTLAELRAWIATAIQATRLLILLHDLVVKLARWFDGE